MILKSLYVRLSTLWVKRLFEKEDHILMSKIYFNRLVIGTIVFDAIPAKYQDAVKAYGREWVESERLSVEEYELLYKEEYVA